MSFHVNKLDISAKLYTRFNRDQNDSLEFEAKIKSAIRQEDVHSELKNIVKSVVETSIGQRGSNDSLERELRKLMKSEINNFIMSKNW